MYFGLFRSFSNFFQGHPFQSQRDARPSLPSRPRLPRSLEEEVGLDAFPRAEVVLVLLQTLSGLGLHGAPAGPPHIAMGGIARSLRG